MSIMLRATCIAPLLVGLALVPGCGGSDDTSKDAYEASVVKVRDRVDSALADISQAKSRPDLFNRMDVAGEAIARAAEDFDKNDPPEEFRDQDRELVDALESLATDLGATASDLRNYPELLEGTRSRRVRRQRHRGTSYREPLEHAIGKGWSVTRSSPFLWVGEYLFD